MLGQLKGKGGSSRKVSLGITSWDVKNIRFVHSKTMISGHVRTKKTI
jgi:hypothetical protein